MKYEEAILKLLRARGPGKTICPSELLEGREKQNPAKMEEVRSAARRLEAKGSIEITQKGKRIDPTAIRGPIRLRLLP